MKKRDKTKVDLNIALSNNVTEIKGEKTETKR